MNNAQAVVVLGRGINPDGTLPLDPQMRVRTGVEVLKHQSEAFLVMSGKWSFQLAIPPTRIEAEAMRDYAVQLGVPEDRIIMEVHSLDTISNAYYVKAHVLIPKQWHRLIVVSSVDHIERSEYIFRQVLGPEYEMAFIASSLTLSDVELEPMRQKEQRSLWGAKRLFQGIAPGDHEAIYHQVLERYIPGIGPDRTLAEQNITTLLAEYKQILEK